MSASVALPAPGWAGLHLGVNLGVGFGGAHTVVTSAAPVFTGLVPDGQVSALTAFANGASFLGGKSAFLGGGQFGYDFQFGSAVVGLEADIAALSGVASSGGYSSLNAIGAAPVITTATVGRSLHYLGTVRGRVGFAVAPSILLYATGGLAYGDPSGRAQLVQVGTTIGRVGVGSAAISGVRAGWTLGAGAEWMFASNWSAKLEYLYYDLGARNWNSPLTVAAPAALLGVPYAVTTQSVRANGHLVRAGLNYRFDFGGPAPVVARY